MSPIIGTLWGDASQRQTKVILSVAALNGLELEQPAWSFQNKPADFTSKFPYGKIPAFEGNDGFKLIEGAPIAEYLSSIGTRVDLLGRNARDAAIVDQWVHFAEHEIGAPTYAIVGQIFGFGGPFVREMFDKYTEQLVRSLKYLESSLANRTTGYLALETLTLADLVVAGTIYNAARVALGSAERAQYPQIFAHYAKVTGDERVKQYWSTEGFTEVRFTEPTKYPGS